MMAAAAEGEGVGVGLQRALATERERTTRRDSDEMTKKTAGTGQRQHAAAA